MLCELSVMHRWLSQSYTPDGHLWFSAPQSRVRRLNRPHPSDKTSRSSFHRTAPSAGTFRPGEVFSGAIKEQRDKMTAMWNKRTIHYGKAEGERAMSPGRNKSKEKPKAAIRTAASPEAEQQCALCVCVPRGRVSVCVDSCWGEVDEIFGGAWLKIKVFFISYLYIYLVLFDLVLFRHTLTSEIGKKVVFGNLAHAVKDTYTRTHTA